jgi:hypothetical protein
MVEVRLGRDGIVLLPWMESSTCRHKGDHDGAQMRRLKAEGSAKVPAGK